MLGSRGIVKAPSSQPAALPALTQLLTSRLHAVHKAHRDKRARQSFASNRRSSTLSGLRHFVFQVLPFYGLCPPSRGAVARSSTGSRAKKKTGSAFVTGVCLCVPGSTTSGRDDDYMNAGSHGEVASLSFCGCLCVCVCVCVCSVSRSLTVFVNGCADSACRVYVMCGLRTQRSHAHPEN